MQNLNKFIEDMPNNLKGFVLVHLFAGTIDGVVEIIILKLIYDINIFAFILLTNIDNIKRVGY